MTNNADARLAREWAENVNPMMPKEYVCAARDYILATTTPPTMADVEWDDAVHGGLCADHPDNGMVRMIHAVHALVWCYHGTRMGWLAKADLTPLPGTRVDLTPRRESVPESTSEHPEVLTTKEDYENAPEGTIVANDSCFPRVKDRLGFWVRCGVGGAENSAEAALHARRVLRWGWGA